VVTDARCIDFEADIAQSWSWIGDSERELEHFKDADKDIVNSKSLLGVSTEHGLLDFVPEHRGDVTR
jgi:hypothetical protein